MIVSNEVIDRIAHYRSEELKVDLVVRAGDGSPEFSENLRLHTWRGGKLWVLAGQGLTKAPAAVVAVACEVEKRGWVDARLMSAFGDEAKQLDC